MVKLFGAVALLGAVTHAQNTTSLPEVDLGYEIYRAASFNVRSIYAIAWKEHLVIPSSSIGLKTCQLLQFANTF
jgi:hypothetical protein